MRRAVIVFVVLSAATASSQPAQPKVTVLDLHVVGADTETTRIAGELSRGLRSPSSKFKGPYAFAQNTEKADFKVSGQLDAVRTGYKLTLQLLDVATQQITRSSMRVIPTADIKARLLQHARAAYLNVTGIKTGTLALKVTPPTAMVAIDGEGHATGSVDVELAEGDHELQIRAPNHVPHTATFTINPSRPSKIAVALVIDKVAAACDYDGLLEKGDNLFAQGVYAAALSMFEKAVSCKPEVTTLLAKLVITACRARNLPKVKIYAAKLPQDKRDRLLQYCIPPSPPPWDRD